MDADERSQASKLRFPFNVSKRFDHGSMILRVYLNVLLEVRILETMMFCNRGEQISRIVEND